MFACVCLFYFAHLHLSLQESPTLVTLLSQWSSHCSHSEPALWWEYATEIKNTHTRTKQFNTNKYHFNTHCYFCSIQDKCDTLYLWDNWKRISHLSWIKLTSYLFLMQIVSPGSDMLFVDVNFRPLYQQLYCWTNVLLYEDVSLLIRATSSPTLSTNTLLFTGVLTGGRTYRSAVVGRPGFTMVTKESWGTPVSY